MPRFFVSEAVGDTVKITGDDARHIARSLRMAVGDTVTVSDGEGRDFECRLTKIRDEECECDVLSSSESAGEPPVEITLFMAYPKGDKLETVIQKAVELGACRIIPFESSRCIKRPDRDKAQKIRARLSRIAEEAAKQCGRGSLVTVCDMMTFKEAVAAAAKDDLSLFCYEGESAVSVAKALSEAENCPEKVSFMIGSEGGFSTAEAALAVEGGMKSVTLGSRILRTETASSFLLACLSYEFEMEE